MISIEAIIYCLLKSLIKDSFLVDSIDKLRSKDVEYRRVILRGTFEHSKELHVFPRSLNEGAHGAGGFGRQPKSGGHIITPFKITNTG